MDSSKFDLDGYLRRLGHAGATEPTLDTLTALQAQHALRVPFENLDPLLGRKARLDAASLQEKLVRQGRGGYCFEHNSLFQMVLETLGFAVTAYAARVLYRRSLDAVSPRTHMLLRVELREGPFLVDVGFGGCTPTKPLALIAEVEQATPQEQFRLLRHGGEYLLQIRQDDDWQPIYRFVPERQHPIDLELANCYVSTHPESPFVNHLMAARPTADGRLGLFDRALSVRDRERVIETTQFAYGNAVVAALEGRFLVQLARDDRGAVARRIDALAAAASG